MQDCKKEFVDATGGIRSTIAEQFAPYTYALMRIVFGFLFICHGLQKLFGMFAGRTADLTSSRGFAGMIELVAGAMIMLGWYARPVALIASGEMAVAYFLFQQPAGLLPIQNGGEPAVLYCLAFLFMAARGAGVFSMDGARRGS